MAPELLHFIRPHPVIDPGYMGSVCRDAYRVIRVRLVHAERLPEGMCVPARTGIEYGEQPLQFLRDPGDRLVQDGRPGVPFLLSIRRKVDLPSVDTPMAAPTEARQVVPEVGASPVPGDQVVVVFYPPAAAQAFSVLKMPDVVLYVMVAPELPVLEIGAPDASVIELHEGKTVDLQCPCVRGEERPDPADHVHVGLDELPD